MVEQRQVDARSALEIFGDSFWIHTPTGAGAADGDWLHIPVFLRINY